MEGANAMTQKNALAFHSVTIKSGDNYNPPKAIHHAGFTAIEYAAIHTGQPCSGTPWLDEMLAKARRERLAGQIAAQLATNATPEHWSVQLADALIAALEGGAK